MSLDYMRIQFETIIRKYGHNIYLQRRSKDADCPSEALYPDVLEKHTVRFSIANTRSLMGRTQEQMEGILSTSERIYYFLINAHPFDGDRIYDYDENAKIQTIWTVDTSIPMRGLNGNIEYYSAGVTRTLPN